MTFRDQLRTTFRVGSRILLTGAVLFIALQGARMAGYATLYDVLFVLTVVAAAVGALTLAGGLIGRSAHRWVWFNVIMRSERTVFGQTVSQRALGSPASPILRFWLHLDRDGRDRDSPA